MAIWNAVAGTNMHREIIYLTHYQGMHQRERSALTQELVP